MLSYFRPREDTSRCKGLALRLEERHRLAHAEIAPGTPPARPFASGSWRLVADYEGTEGRGTRFDSGSEEWVRGFHIPFVCCE